VTFKLEVKWYSSEKVLGIAQTIEQKLNLYVLFVLAKRSFIRVSTLWQLAVGGRSHSTAQGWVCVVWG
jgi:hypothetical protein